MHDSWGFVEIPQLKKLTPNKIEKDKSMRTRSFLLTALPLLLAGCAETITGYNRPYNFTAPEVRKHDYRSTAFRTNYDNLLSQSNFITSVNSLERARMERNQILTELIGIIEAEHGEYERAMVLRKSTMEMIFDFAELGLSGAGTVVGGEGTKAILAAIATGTKGADISLNKRVFHDQAVEALQAQMRAAQKDRKAQMIQSMTNSVLAYPLEMGLADVVGFYYDGTLTRAFQNMVKDAKDKEEESDTELSVAKGVRPTAHRGRTRDSDNATNSPPGSARPR